MISNKLIVLTCLCSVLWVTTIHAQHAEQPLVDTIVEVFIEKANLPGLSLAVSKDENVIFAKGYGYADIKSQLPMSTDTRLRTASVAKVITTTALARLVSEEKVDLDAPIKTYIPYIDDMYAHLTTRQLAGHTSGMPHRPEGSNYKKKQYTSIKETVLLMDTPLLFTPDTDYKYSTHAFNLIAAVIEGASQKSFENYLNGSIFSSLDMNHTYAENINTLSKEDATLYYIKNDKLRPEKLTNASYKLPGAGFRSTPIDLVHMMQAYTNGFISKESVNSIFKSHQLINGKKTNVGITWRSSYDPFGNRTIEHAGSWRGTRTVVVHYPDENMNIAIMINADCPIFIEETAHILINIFREHPTSEPKPKDLHHTINVAYTFNDTKGDYKGTLSLDGIKGKLTVSNNPLLNTSPIYYLGYKNHYAVVTQYGLMYANIDQTPVINGNLYLYHTRNSTNPTEGTPLAVLTVD